MNQYEMKQRAYQSNLKSRALQVLLYLIDRSNKEQTCFPAVPTIGKELHISISTVKRAMKELVDAGYVTKESRFRAGNRGQTSNLYTLYFPEQEECGNLDKAVSKAEKNKTITKKYEENTQKMIVDENVDCKNQNEIERSGAEQNIQSKKENLIVGSLKKRECKRKLNPILRHNGIQMAFEVGCSFIMSIIICCACGQMIDGIIFFGVFIPLRSYLGGFHMNSYWACFICSSTVLVGILLLVRFCNPNPIVSWIMLIFSVVIIVWKAKKASEVDEEGQHYYPRICIIVVGILFVSIIFFAISKFSLLFLIACTNVLVVISKFLEKRQEE